ncbi:MMPL family transporter [Amycolatopsis sp. CA-230715]|uniref:MMPL family transporter n=1 Tax=Amycolatopsis sp. CA-230715 TaxID=2745196 RepID=UPI001C016217|nr:MMPL family transporter [Amycolatopsis sp. CA-230715]QWF83353.1 Heme uptake protein MmpL11 [Amycolatopsis sp. CA-230715]
MAQPTTARIARWSANHPWRAIVGWVVFVAVCFAAGSLAGSRPPENKDFWIGEAGRAEAVATQAGLMPPPVEQVLITAPGGVDDPSATAAAASVTTRMRALPSVSAVAAPARSADGSTLMVAVTLKADDRTSKTVVPEVSAQTAAVADAFPGLRVEQTGSSSISVGINKQFGDDLARSEMITLPVTLVILFLVFGSIIAAGVPLLLALSSVGAATGLYAIASHFFPDAGGAVSSVILMIGMAVGVDYSLFYLKRVREERERSGGVLSRTAAVELAAATAGHAVVVSGLAVLVALAGLYFAGDVVFSSIATGSIIVVLVSVVSSLTVLPALLAKLGKRTDPGRFAWRGGTSRLWPVLLRPALERPLATLLAGVVALGLLALPATALQLKVEGNDTFSREVTEVAAYDRLTSLFPTEGVAHLVVANGGGATAGLTELASRAQTDPAFLRTDTPRIRTSSDGRAAALELPIRYDGNSPEAAKSLQHLRNDLIPSLRGTDVTYAVSGGVARNTDYVEHQNERLPWVLGSVLLLTFLMMLFSFRSAVLALAGIVLNVLSAAAAFGVMVAVFQHSWAEPLLGFTSSGFLGAHLPLFVLVVLFGLSMDYQVFVVSRIREAAGRGLPARRAVFDGVVGSAGMITSAALIMVSVFASFLFVDRLEMKQIGFGLAVAVLIDAVLVRALVLPAVIALFGEKTWWPGRLRAPSSGAHRRSAPRSAFPAPPADRDAPLSRGPRASG